MKNLTSLVAQSALVAVVASSVSFAPMNVFASKTSNSTHQKHAQTMKMKGGWPKATPTPTPTSTPTPTPELTPSPTPTPCGGTCRPKTCGGTCGPKIGIGQSTNIIANGNVQSTQVATVIGEKHEQTIIQHIQNIIQKDDKEDAEDVVTLVKTDGLESARPGEVLTYRIVIRNPGDEDLTEVRIVDRVSPYLIPLATSPAARADAKSRTITWENQTISAKAEVTYTFRARVAENTPDGFLLQNVVDVNGPGLRLNATDTTRVIAPEVAGAVEAPRPVPVTAQTGTPLSMLSLILSMAGSVSTAGTLMIKRFI